MPLAALADLRLTAGPDPVARYNGFASADISGAPAPGVGSGEALPKLLSGFGEVKEIKLAPES